LIDGFKKALFISITIIDNYSDSKVTKLGIVLPSVDKLKFSIIKFVHQISAALK